MFGLHLHPRAQHAKYPSTQFTEQPPETPSAKTIPGEIVHAVECNPPLKHPSLSTGVYSLTLAVSFSTVHICVCGVCSEACLWVLVPLVAKRNTLNDSSRSIIVFIGISKLICV